MRRAAMAGIVFAFALARTRTASADTQACIAAAERGEQLRRDGHLRDAQAAFIACQRECPAAIVRDCTRWLEETQRSQPTIVVRALDPHAREVTDVALFIDDVRVAEHLDGRALSVDPGRHTLRIDWTAGPPATVELLAREGERERLVDVQLVTTASAAVPVRPASASWPAWIIGGVGLAAMGAGASLWAIGSNERAQLFDTCGVTRLCTSDDKASAQTKLVAGDVSFFTGVAFVVAASIWLVATASHRARPPLAAALRF